jgi:hypothetical protein
MAKDPLSQLSNVNSALGTTEKRLSAIEGLVKRIGGFASTSLKQVSNILSPSVGQGTNMTLGTSGAQFSNGAGGGAGQGGMMPWLYTKQGAATVAGVQIGMGAAAGAYAALPDLGMTVSRATGFYQASLRSGGAMSRAGLAQATFGALGGGITGPGEDAAAAAMLVQGYGYMPGSADFTRAMREVGGAARYLGMPNATAAQAIGGLHTGSMGGNLYQYGISTFDPNTGRARSTGDIARQLFTRMTQGRQVTAEQMALSLREGFAGQSLKALGFSQAQQEIFGTMLTDMAAGRTVSTDLENAPFNPANPLNAQLQIATSMTSLMERGTEPMIAGFEKAAGAVAALNKSLEGLPDAFFQLKGAVQGFSGTNVGAGVSGLVGGIAGAAGTILTYKGLKSVLGGAVRGASTNAAVQTAGRVGLTGLGRAVPVLGGAASAATGQGFLSTVGIGAAAGGIGGAFFGGIGAVPGAIGGGILSGLGYLGTKALASMFGTPANAAQTSQTGTQMTAGMDQGLMQTLQNAGFSGQSLTTAYGIVKAESGGRANAYNPTGMDDSYGLFQINMENNDPRNPNMGNKRNAAYLKKYASIGYTGPESLKDPNINARIAYDISKGGTNFNPWTTYTSGKYLQHTSGVSTANVGTKTVNVNVNLANASIAEANSLAKKIKEILLNDKDLQTMGSK